MWKFVALLFELDILISECRVIPPVSLTESFLNAVESSSTEYPENNII